ncbi:hypothetical protein HYX10_02470 [Candidatus Woesearchaeota archaeon]|nr:hypothetical protein [Candidatus Woesearchaeota archaeon]
MEAVVKDVVRETPTVVIVKLSFNGNPFSFKPGQFLQVVLEKDGKMIRKPYSISSSPGTNGSVEFCVKVVPDGFASNYLANLKPGQKLGILGPFGHFVLQEKIANDLVFMAAGTGISAIKPLAEEALQRASENVWLFFGVRSEQEIIYRQLFEALASKHLNFHFVPVLSKSGNSEYEHGRVQDAFKKLIAPGSQDVYICGLHVMVDEVRALCKELGFPNEKIHYEKYI